MNFTPQLTALQGVMISADNVHSFSNLTAKGGNEEEIKEVVLCLKNFLEKEKYIKNNSIEGNCIEITRKLVFYLILNADLKILESMVDKEGLDFLIWTIPTVPKCLMCELLWKLHMEQFVKEVIAFSCPELSLEMADCFINHMKYMSPMQSADKIRLISAACYKFICRLNFFDINENLLNSVYNIFQKCLKYFPTPPNVGKLESLKRNQLYKYIGDTLHKLLLLLYECFNEFNGTQKFELQDNINIYMLTYNEESIVFKNDIKTCNSKQIVLDCLYKCHEALLEILKELVMGVSVDIFCTWSEFDDNGKSMQQIIGELCYKLRDMLMRIECVMDHPVVEMLKQISCKPVAITDVINTTSSEDILENINNGIDKHLWVQALLKKNDLFKDSILIDTITSNLNLLQENDVHAIYLDCIEHLKNSNNNEASVKLLAIKAFQYCNVTTKLNIIDKTFSNKIFNDNMRTNELEIMMNNIFNKLIATLDEDLSDILCVFIQSPKTVYRKILKLATENVHQSIIMGRIMIYLEKYSHYFYSDETEPCLIKIMQEIAQSGIENEAQQSNFITFVKNIKDSNIIACSTLLLLVTMPALHAALINKNLSNITIQLKLLLVAFCIDELLDYRAPMVAMIAQVLEVVRWKIATFNASYPSCLELAIKLQKTIMESYKNNIPDKDSTWLKSKLKNKNPLNMYYYRMLYSPCGKTYFEILTGISLDGIDNEKLSFLLSKILPLTVLDEWYELWEDIPLDNDTKLSVFHDAVMLTQGATKDECTKQILACVLYCHRNFLVLIKHKYIYEPITDKQVCTIMGQLAAIAEKLDKENVDEFKSLLLPLLGYVAERRNDFTLDVYDFLNNTCSSQLLLEIVQTVFQ